MRGRTAIAIVQAVRWRLERSKCYDPLDQFVDLPIGLEERAQVQPAITEQAQVQRLAGYGRRGAPFAFCSCHCDASNGGASLRRVTAENRGCVS